MIGVTHKNTSIDHIMTSTCKCGLQSNAPQCYSNQIRSEWELFGSFELFPFQMVTEEKRGVACRRTHPDNFLPH